MTKAIIALVFVSITNLAPQWSSRPSLIYQIVFLNFIQTETPHFHAFFIHKYCKPFISINIGPLNIIDELKRFKIVQPKKEIFV